MLALMPRVSGCVLCGQTIPGRGRIDRIYCSVSARPSPRAVGGTALPCMGKRSWVRGKQPI